MKHVFILLLLLFWNDKGDAQPAKKSVQMYQLVFQNKVGNDILDVDSTYQNHFGEAFKVRSFKYYISYVKLKYKEGKSYSINAAPHLVNEADSTSKLFSFMAPAGAVTNVQFLLGIDSITNTKGVQTGDLDPAKGMFWVWNTGYIMAKLEGISPSSKAPAKQYSYDIGGFKKGENVTKLVSLPLHLAVSNQPSAFIITADISKWFYGKNNILISEQPMCHSPGVLAVQVADNYADMFSIRTQ